ncbi:MAG TPA: DUF1579 family protein [Terriglobales bacterium]|nr:DUF1579 family protein [Terriglobales bacterium]
MRAVGAAVLFALIGTLVLTAVAQQQQPQPGAASNAQRQPGNAPTPQQMMGYFAGDWKLTGTQKISPSSPPAPYTSTEHGEWVGTDFLEIHAVSHGPLGDIHSVRMIEYNPANQMFTFNAYNSLGEHQVATCNPQGTQWTWNVEQKMNGVTTNARRVLTLTSPNSYTFKTEVQNPAGAWVTVMEGTAARAQ